MDMREMKSLPCIMHFDRKGNVVMIQLIYDLTLTNDKGGVWHFEKWWKSDGHSTGEYFRHFDAWLAAALCHDLDCENAEKTGDVSIRKQGDKDYKYNLDYLGAPESTEVRRFVGVSIYRRFLRMMGKLK